MKLKVFISIHPTIINEKTTEVFFKKDAVDYLKSRKPNLIFVEKTIDIPDALLKKGAKPKKSGKVTTICYNKRDTWNSAKEAIAYFNDAANNSDGCERERYLTIVSKLVDGETKDVTDSFN